MRHVFFTGEKSVGKTNLVNALLRGRGRVGGFRTVKSDGAVYLLRPGEEMCEENRVFFCGRDADAARFDRLGCEALSVSCDCIRMDELGPHEQNAKEFQNAVFRALDGTVPIIGVIQKSDSDFLRKVKAHPNVRLIEVTRENRDILYETLVGMTVDREIRRFAVLDSSNDELKRMIAAGIDTDGLAVIAAEQTAGRGRRGREFLSAAGKGVYISALLKPECPAALLPSLTAGTAVAVCDAIQKTCGICAQIKWPNDVIVNGKKLCGILTELVMTEKPCVIVGIGVNAKQTAENFGSVLAETATSLAQLMEIPPDTELFTESLLRELDTMYRLFPAAKTDYLERYRQNCLTRGRVVVHTQTGERPADVLDIAEDFSLSVRYPDGNCENLCFGEVSVRGVYGYT